MRKGSFATGVALTLMLGMGLTSTVPGRGSPDGQRAGSSVGDRRWSVLPRQLDRQPGRAGQGQDQRIRLQRQRGPCGAGCSSGSPRSMRLATRARVSSRRSTRPVPAFDRAYFDVQAPGQACVLPCGGVESFSALEGEVSAARGARGGVLPARSRRESRQEADDLGLLLRLGGLRLRARAAPPAAAVPRRGLGIHVQ